jgi:hypothetical protein
VTTTPAAKRSKLRWTSAKLCIDSNAGAATTGTAQPPVRAVANAPALPLRGVASAILGLALSALARSNEQIMPMLVVSVMSRLVFSGGMIPVTERLVLDQLSGATPARWGFAASASTANLPLLEPRPLSPTDPHWAHTPSGWLFDMAMLVALSLSTPGSTASSSTSPVCRWSARPTSISLNRPRG